MVSVREVVPWSKRELSTMQIAMHETDINKNSITV